MYVVLNALVILIILIYTIYILYRHKVRAKDIKNIIGKRIDDVLTMQSTTGVLYINCRFLLVVYSFNCVFPGKVQTGCFPTL